MKVYLGRRVAGGVVVEVLEGNERRALGAGAGQALRNHSPDGFEWGYGGAGPAQLALAILLDFTGSAEISEKLYQRFKWHFVAGWPESWTLADHEIAAWLTTFPEEDK